MVIGIFGESCTGKSTLAESLKRPLLAGVYAGKDYLRVAPQEETARAEFAALLRRHAAGGAHIIYIAAEPEQLALLPAGENDRAAGRDQGALFCPHRRQAAAPCGSHAGAEAWLL